MSIVKQKYLNFTDFCKALSLNYLSLEHNILHGVTVSIAL